METKVERLDDNKVKVSCTIPAETVDTLFKTAVKETNKKQRVPGFRPGKAPRNVLESALGKDYFATMVTEGILNEIAPTVIDEQDIVFLGDPEFAEVDLAVEGQDFTFECTGEVKPVCTISSSEPVSIELPPTQATDDEIDKQVDVLREYYVLYEDLDRASQMGDTVFADIECSIDGEPLKGISGPDHQIELGSQMMPDGFDEGLVGVKPGDEVEYEFSVEDDPMGVVDSSDVVHVKAKVNRVTEKVLPELTDEWVKETCSYADVAELRSRIASSIVSQKAEMLSRLKEDACAAALAERLQGEPSEAFIESTTAEMLRAFFSQLQQQGMSLEQYCINAGISPEQLREDITDQAEGRARENLALDALADALGFEVTADDVRNEFRSTGMENAMEIMESWRKNGRLSVIRESIRRSRATDWLLNTAMVSYLDADEAAAKAEAKAEEKAAAKAAKAGKDTSDDQPQLEKMTVAQLKELAAEKGVDLKGISKKADIIAAIRG